MNPAAPGSPLRRLDGFRVHDLLRLHPVVRPVSEISAPDWVCEALAAAPWVVVRRAPGQGGQIPIGVRGSGRNRRWAAWIDPSAVIERLAPEALVRRLPTLPSARTGTLPALTALAKLEAAFASLARPWGPVGSAGFELASGWPTVTETSDLDVILRCEEPLDHGVASDLIHAVGSLGVRCDVLLETPAGGVALLEFARTSGPVAARGPDGPRLVEDPWRFEATP